jgi:N-acetylglucosaminyldiphosphoundecaprenol N-acetyl-beta-D-mannosaminyltransferase
VKRIDEINLRRWCNSNHELRSMAVDAVNGRKKCDRFWVYCINLYSIALIEKHTGFRLANSASSRAVADGVTITALSILKGWPKRERLPGSDVFDIFLKVPIKRSKLRCFFFGSDAQTIDAIRARLSVDYRDVVFVGGLAPPFSENGFSDLDEQFVREINNAEPDILFVGLTQPKQEIWLNKNFEALNVPVAACIGAVFDFYAGNKKRAPVFFRLLGLEWCYRLAQDPKKIFDRFKYSLPILIRYLVSR